MGLQLDKTYKLLKQAGNKGVPNYAFYQNRILRPSARIAELRQDGHNIQAERQHLPNGRATNVWKYYLIEDKKSWWKLNRKK